MKTYAQFFIEASEGGSPYKEYKPKPQPAPSSPPPGFREKYLDPLKKGNKVKGV